MNNPFQQATKSDSYLKLLITGSSGSGKTFSALNIAKGLGMGKPAVVDSEHGSAAKYADVFNFDVVCPLQYSPATYIQMIDAAIEAGYKIVILDSLTHCWKWCLDETTRVTERSNSKNSYNAWGKVTPLWDALLNKIVQSPIHVIATGRAKTDYEETVDERGKKTYKKVGLAPILRAEADFEFDIVMEMNAEHHGIITKTRCSALTDAVIDRPNGQVSSTLLKWLTASPDQVRKSAPSAPAPAPTTSPAANPVSSVIASIDKATPEEMAQARIELKGCNIPADMLAELKAVPTSSRLKEIVRGVLYAQSMTNGAKPVAAPASAPAHDDAPPTQVPDDVQGGDFA